MTRTRSVVVAVLCLVLAVSAEAAKKNLNGKIAWIDVNGQLGLASPDGNGGTEVTNSIREFDAAVSADGKRIVTSAGSNAGFDIFTMDINGSNVVQLTTSGGNRFPQWSPDGKRIVFESGQADVFIMNADGTNQTRLTLDGGSFEPSFSPNGNKILFVSDRTGRDELFTMNPDGTGAVQVTNLTDQKFNPKFSPDASHIIYERWTAFWQRPEICTVDASGNNFTVVAKGEDGVTIFHYATLWPPSNPTFSPDGTKIAYSMTRNGKTITFVNNPDGSNETQVQPGTMESWQPLSPVETVGVYRPSNGQWILRSSTASTALTQTVTFGGQAGDLPVTGDFDGDGRTDIGIFRNGTFLLARLKTTFPCFGCAATLSAEQFATVSFGQAGDIPIAGDWDADTVDDLGVFRPGDAGTMIFRIKHVTFTRACPTCPFLPVTTFTSESHTFGAAGQLPITGDWDNDGHDSFGVYDPALAKFFVSDDLAEANFTFNFGVSGDRPVAGDWTGHFTDSLGVFRPSTAQWFLASQFGTTTDLRFTFGQSGDIPVAGHWNLVFF
jgi:hypothetical protein